MQIDCPICKKTFEVDASLIPEQGRLLQCGDCNYKWFFKEDESSNETLPTQPIKSIKNLSSLPLFIDDTPNVSVQDIRSKIKKILFEQNKIGLIVIDYLQLLLNSKLKSENRVQELSQITRALKNIAKEFQIPVIALSQLSRNVESRINKRPVLSDLRESGSIEQDADLVLMLYRENYYNPIAEKNEKVTSAELIIAKHRNGPLGIITLSFQSDPTKFFDTFDDI